MQAVPMEKSINNSDWANEDTQLIDVNDLPELPGYHVLVQPVHVKEKTKGGIIIPEKTQEDISYLFLCHCGKAFVAPAVTLPAGVASIAPSVITPSDFFALSGLFTILYSKMRKATLIPPASRKVIALPNFAYPPKKLEMPLPKRTALSPKESSILTPCDAIY